MSRIGKKPVPLPKGVTAGVQDGTVSVKGPKGELKLKLVPEVQAEVKDGTIAITPRGYGSRACDVGYAAHADQQSGCGRYPGFFGAS